MQLRLFATGVVACLAVAGPLATAQTVGQPAPKPDTARTQAAPEPFGMRLNAPARAEQLLRLKAAEALQAARPQMACVMPMIRADPAFDAAFRRNPPQDTIFHIKKIQPPPCVRKSPGAR